MMRKVRFFFLFCSLTFSLFANDSSEKIPSVDVHFVDQNSSNVKKRPPMVYFHLKNFPKNEPMTLSIKRPLITEEETVVGFSIDDDDKANIDPETIKFSEFFIGCCGYQFLGVLGLGYLKGERALFTFWTKEGKKLAEHAVIPHQIETKSKSGDLILTGELLQLKPAVYHWSLEGVKEGEMYTLRSESKNEVLGYKRAFSSNEFMTLSPDVVGKKTGVGKLTITVRKQKLSIELPWGLALADYSIGDKVSKANDPL